MMYQDNQVISEIYKRIPLDRILLKQLGKGLKLGGALAIKALMSAINKTPDNGINREGKNALNFLTNSKDDLSTLKEDCTIENGKKILIDITDIILNSNNNEIITISDLNIKIGPDETIAIGDTDMTFYMGCYDNNVNNQITRNVFTEKLKTGHSALIQIEGTW